MPLTRQPSPIGQTVGRHAPDGSHESHGRVSFAKAGPLVTEWLAGLGPCRQRAWRGKASGTEEGPALTIQSPHGYVVFWAGPPGANPRAPPVRETLLEG